MPISFDNIKDDSNSRAQYLRIVSVTRPSAKNPERVFWTKLNASCNEHDMCGYLNEDRVTGRRWINHILNGKFECELQNSEFGEFDNQYTIF